MNKILKFATTFFKLASMTIQDALSIMKLKENFTPEELKKTIQTTNI